jgi:hypothetical protein
MNYDLAQLFDHPLKFRNCIPSAIVTFGGQSSGRYEVDVSWRRAAGAPPASERLVLFWDTDALRAEFDEVEDEIEILRSRDADRDTRLELTAVVVAVAVMAHIEPASRFTFRLAPGLRHDYRLNETTDEMIEIAGRWEAGLPGLFELKKEQSDKNQTPKKRWVSVTVFHTTPRNRTEGLHT